jgi:predicted Zn-dependent protease
MSRFNTFIIITFLLFLPVFGEVFAFVYNRSDSGAEVKWSSPASLNFYLNPSNSDGLNESQVNTIAASSFSNWESNLTFNLNLNTTSYSSNGRNDIYFTNSSSFFSDSGIVAVTAITYNESTAAILETDIIFNDSTNTFSTNYGDENYIGDILSHEVGHALGLSHSQVFGSTMFYRTRLGQLSIEVDDINGAKELYGNVNSNLGTISGTVIGSSSLTPIFAAHVSVISQSTGAVVAASVSEDDGSFSISGLDLDDVYYIYTQPLEALSSLPDYYNTRRTDFCENGTSYRGSFFQSCSTSDRGYPQGVELSSSAKEIDLGYVSIRCGLDTPTDYMLGKSGSNFELNAFSSVDSTAYIGEAFVGYFSDAEVTAESEDTISLDLSSVIWNDYINLTSSKLYLEVKVITQPFYSAYKTQLTIESAAGTETKPDDFNSLSYDSELNPDLDVVAYFAIDKVSIANNDFTIKVKAKDLSGDITGSISLNDIIPSSDDFMDDLAFYLLTANIVEKTTDAYGADVYTKVTDKKRESLTDNKTCPDASYAYQVTSKVVDSSASSSYKRKSDDVNPIACGSIALSGKGGPPSGGPMSLAMFMLIYIIFTRYKSLSFLNDKYHNK